MWTTSRWPAGSVLRPGEGDPPCAGLGLARCALATGQRGSLRRPCGPCLVSVEGRHTPRPPRHPAAAPGQVGRVRGALVQGAGVHVAPPDQLRALHRAARVASCACPTVVASARRCGPLARVGGDQLAPVDVPVCGSPGEPLASLAPERSALAASAVSAALDALASCVTVSAAAPLWPHHVKSVPALRDGPWSHPRPPAPASR